MLSFCNKSKNMEVELNSLTQVKFCACVRERGGDVSMAKIEVIADLIRSIGLGNKKRAREIIENMVRYENESGKTGAGLKLQYALRTWGEACEMAELPQNAKQFVFDSQPQKT